MEPTIPMSTLAQRLQRLKLLLCVILPVAFEVVIEFLSTLFNEINDWRDMIIIPPFLFVALVKFIIGALNDCNIALKTQISPTFPPRDVIDFDPSAVLVAKIEIIPSLISEAAHGAVTVAYRSLPYRVKNREDLMKLGKAPFQFLRAFTFLVSRKYNTWLHTRNFRSSFVLGEDDLSSALRSSWSSLLEALKNLPDEMAPRPIAASAVQKFRQSIRLTLLRAQLNPNVNVSPHFIMYSFLSRVNGFLLRVWQLLCSPSQLAARLLDIYSLVRSSYQEKQSGPSVILPMSSLKEWPQSRLPKLLLHHSRDLPHHEFGADTSLSDDSDPSSWTVAVIDLNAVPSEVAEGRYCTGADVYGIMTVPFLLRVLSLLFVFSWFNLLVTIAMLFLFSGFGDGTLTLLSQSESFHVSTPAYMLLLDEEFSVVLRGNQGLVEAIATKGFHFSHAFADFLRGPIWKLVGSLMFEGSIQGVLYLIGVVLVFRFFNSSFTSTMSHIGERRILINRLAYITPLGSFRHLVWWHDSDFWTRMARVCVALFTDVIRVMGKEPVVSLFLILPADLAALKGLEFLADQLVSVGIFSFLLLPSQDYPAIWTTTLLDVLGRPPVKKWRFKSLAAAATFQCLALCHGARRPVRHLDVRGVLDTLIRDQSEVWRVWKARVADRIAHEEDILFAPTLPTFRHAQRQRQFEALLSEAQCAYDAYHGRFHWVQRHQ